MEYKLKTAYYIAGLNTIGGIETHLYYLAKRYAGRDVTILTKYHCDEYQLRRIRKYWRVIELKPQDKVECDLIFLTYDLSALKQVKAKEMYFVIHNDYATLIENGNMPKGSDKIIPGVSKYIAVSEAARKGYNPKAKPETHYFPIEMDEFEEPILLFSATRLTSEKGPKRYEKLAKALDDAKVNYQWHIYANTPESFQSPNVIFMPPRLDIVSKMPLYDGCVQLSDVEGFSLTLIEAQTLGIPLIVTPLPMITEDMKLDDRSAIIISFDMQDIGKQIEQIRHLKQMKDRMPKWSMPKDGWDELIPNIPNKYEGVKPMKVKATGEWKKRNIKDAGLGRIPEPGEIYEVDAARAEMLMGKNKYKAVFVEEVEEEMKIDQAALDIINAPIADEVPLEMQEEKPAPKKRARARKPKAAE